jgi:hypothetical protein
VRTLPCRAADRRDVLGVPLPHPRPAAEDDRRPNPKMVAQLCGLERRTTRGTGRDIVDHPPNAHDDLINAVAGALCLANLGPAPLKFHVPIIASRAAYMADYVAGIFDPAGAGSCEKPGGWEPGDPRAGGLDVWPGMRN